MTDRGRNDAYVTEDECWEGTPLAERPGFATLCSEARLILDHPFWVWGKVEIRSIRPGVHLGKGTRGWIGLAPRATRYTLTHELAHAATPTANHGPEWKGAYIDLTTLAYGVHYGDRLRQSFADMGLLVEGGTRRVTRPLIDVDQLLGEVVGGWRRP